MDFLGEKIVVFLNSLRNAQKRDKNKHKMKNKIKHVIAHLADHVPCGWNPITFLIARFIHSRLVLWNKHHQARLFSKRKSRIHSNGPIQRTKTHSPSCT
jgi:hypothetical protein